MRGRMLFAVMLLSQIAAFAGADPSIAGRIATPAPAPHLNVVSEDPYTNAGTYHRTQVEPVSAAFGSTIVSVFQSGRSYNWGASNFGWSVSADAGATWTDGFLPGTTIHATPPGRWQRVTDPAIAYDAKHDTWLIVGLGARPCSLSGECAGAQVFVSRSTDGGQTFGEPFVPRRATHSESFNQPWIGCDNTPSNPFYGNCYAVWNDDWHRSLLHVSTSVDGGLTWIKGAVVREHHCVAGPTVVVQPDGTVVIPFKESCEGTYMELTFVSADGGASYAGPFSIPSFDHRAPAANLRAGGIGRFDLDADGRIYGTWTDCSFRHALEGVCTHNDIVLSSSDDGRHWGDMLRIPIESVTSSADHFLSAIAVDPETSGTSARIAIAYYFHPEQWCDANTCRLYVGLASSLDGGTTWSFQTLAGPFKNRWFPLTDSGHMVGEYIGISFVDGNAIPVFTVASEGECELGDVTSCNVWIASATVPLG